MNPGERRCWDCGNVAMHEDNIVPHVLCRKCGSQDTRLTRKHPFPKSITAGEPECPHCGLVHEMPGSGVYYKIDCDCGWSFDVQRKTVIVSSPRENRD